MKWRSQCGQDRWAFDFFNGKTEGTFIEVGALDGLRFSNTAALEDAGWRGACIEPLSSNFKRLLRNRPLARCINVAIDAQEGHKELLVPLCKSKPGVATFLPEEKARWGGEWTTELVKTMPLGDLFPKLENLDFLSIDIEGMDLVALETWRWEKCRPKLIIVEFGRNESLIRAKMESENYQLIHRDHQDLYFQPE